MYDFEGDAGAGATQHDGPSRLLTLLELPRWIGEYAASRAWDVLARPTDDGAGRPVLVIPGFSGTDLMTGRLRGHLHRRGHPVHGWGQGRNVGLVDPLIDGLRARLTSLHDRHQQPVSLVGWSFGGLLARWLAHEHPDAVRQVVCLSSPYRPDGERTRATAMFERSRARHGISDRARDIVVQLRRPVPVPCTAIWSRTDGIVPWRGCRVDVTDDPAPAENIEVPSSHVGMVASPLVLAVVADRLRQDPDDWRAFDWRTCLGQAVLPAPLQAALT